MKRLGGIFEAMIDRQTLAEAFHGVAKGKHRRSDIRRFEANLEENLNDIHRRLADGSFVFGDYAFFEVYDPKERRIAAASVSERIVHHAFVSVAGERLERALIDKSYVCRRGKGQWAAVTEAASLAARHPWCLKFDVKSFFDSIDHDILMRMLGRKIKDARILGLLRRLVGSYETAHGKGQSKNEKFEKQKRGAR